MSLGIGVMIQMLGDDGGTAVAMRHAIGQRITSVAMADDRLRFGLADGSTLEIGDGGQSCCESRYMTCDDDLSGFEGATFLSAETRDAPNVASADEAFGEKHEVQFLVIKTTKGDITAETHNEHNGYYGGFAIEASLTPASGVAA